MMGDPIQSQINIIKELLNLGNLQQSFIESKGKSQLYAPKDCKQIISTILYTEKLYVENFWNIIEFLNAKLQEDDDKNFSFYFPLTRTLTEIYTELLYLINQDEKKGYGICVAQYLFQLSQTYKYAKTENNNPLKELYKSYYEEHNADLLKFPKNIEGFSKKKLGRSGFSFLDVEEIIKKYFNSRNLMNITGDMFYDLHYRIPSEFLHGKIYLLMKSTDKPQNEKFWIIAQCEIISFLFIELVDKNILDKDTDKDIRIIAEKLKNNCSNFKDLWLSKRKSCQI